MGRSWIRLNLLRMTSSGLPPLSMEELACVYSACILADDDIPVTQEKLTTLLKAAEVEVEPIWPMLYARALSGVNIRDMISKAGPCGMSARTRTYSCSSCNRLNRTTCP